MYILLLAAALFILPGTLNRNNALYAISVLFILGAIILLGCSIILIAIKNIPILSPYLPVTLGDNVIKLLAWIGILVVGLLAVLLNIINILGS